MGLKMADTCSTNSISCLPVSVNSFADSPSAISPSPNSCTPTTSASIPTPSTSTSNTTNTDKIRRNPTNTTPSTSITARLLAPQISRLLECFSAAALAKQEQNENEKSHQQSLNNTAQKAAPLTTSKTPNTSLFNSSTAATNISLLNFATRLARYTHISPTAFFCCAVYMCRLFRSAPQMFTAQTCHKLLGACVVLAAKFWDDHTMGNNFYALVVGVPSGALAGLEVELLRLLDFKLIVEAHEFEFVANMLGVNQKIFLS